MKLYWCTKGALGTYDIGVEVGEIVGHPTEGQVLITLVGDSDSVYLVTLDELSVRETGDSLLTLAASVS